MQIGATGDNLLNKWDKRRAITGGLAESSELNKQIKTYLCLWECYTRVLIKHILWQNCVCNACNLMLYQVAGLLLSRWRMAVIVCHLFPTTPDKNKPALTGHDTESHFPCFS